MQRALLILFLTLAMLGLTVLASQPVASPNRVWLVALDAQGRETANLVQPGRLRSAGYHVRSQSVAPADNGCIILAAGQAEGARVVKVLKLRLNGRTEWERTYAVPGRFRIIHRDRDAYVLAGESFEAGHHGLWLMGVSETGDSLWFSRIARQGLQAMQPRPQGGVAAVTMVYDPEAGVSHFNLLLTDSRGRVEHEVRLAEAQDGMGCTGFVITTGGEYLLCGTSWIMLADEQGEVFWHRRIESFETGAIEMVASLKHGFYLLCGYSREPETQLMRWTASKIYPNGDPVWTRWYCEGEMFLNGPGVHHGYALLETEQSHFLIAGRGRAYHKKYQRAASGWLLTLSDAGDSLSSRVIPGPYPGWFNQILPGPDGGLVLAGGAWTPPDESTPRLDTR